MRTSFLILLLIPVLCAAEAGDDQYKAGYAFFRQGKAEESVEFFKQALKANPDHWRAWQALGMSYYKSGKIAQAMEAFQRSLEIHPDNPSLEKFATPLRQRALLADLHDQDGEVEYEGKGKWRRPLPPFKSWRGHGFKVLAGQSGFGGVDASGLYGRPAGGVGLYYELGLRRRWSLAGELLLITRGASAGRGLVNASLIYIEVPILVKHQVWKDIILLLGPQVATPLSASVEVKGFESLGFLREIRGMDYGLVAGIQVPLGKKSTLEFRADLGMVPVFSTGDLRNRSFLLGFSHRLF